MYNIHVLARVLYTRASTCVYARARPLLAKMPPGLDPPLEEKGGNNDSEFKEISNPNSERSEHPPLTPGLDPPLEEVVRNGENYSIRIFNDQSLVSGF